jgi:hypothetical protein
MDSPVFTPVPPNYSLADLWKKQDEVATNVAFASQQAARANARVGEVESSLKTLQATINGNGAVGLAERIRQLEYKASRLEQGLAIVAGSFLAGIGAYLWQMFIK